ncbi:Chromosomal replication initiator protein dnaA [Desulfovibrio sp. X2]|uniref:chromosomal replication initiator protein DnaA n=1 Tax=Desulfovibrio sp. X2 TaxID=941449 RepID=UPI000358707E|nr:chromosomal replication initiator protein DnaA [Desulfovibrio sp. X2]EPR42746.1 Chromosomal replication initiator protein dnaA [Desulfovibrio sp. X2]
MKHGWDHILNILEKRLNPGLFKVWIKPLSATFDDGSLTLIAPNDFVASWVRDRLLDTVAEAAEQVLGSVKSINVKAQAQKAQVASRAQLVSSAVRTIAAPVDADGHSPRTSDRMPAGMGDGLAGAHGQPCSLNGDQSFRWRFSFDDFVVGPSNALAHAASQSVCQCSLHADQLFLCSAPGLGKTHLIQAIGGHLARAAVNRSVRLRYLTAEEFATRMVVALKMGEIERFKAEFRESVDLLLLEDIHFLQGKEKIQDELLATLKALQSRGSKVVFTSSFLPRELSGVDSQLASRFGAGFLAVIDRPDFTTRMRIVEQKAQRQHATIIPEDVSALMAERIKTDIRQLESCLQNLILKAKLLRQNITQDLAMQVLANYAIDADSPDMERIITAVCRTFQLDAGDLASKSRRQGVVMARNTAFFLARKYTDLSLKDIGVRFNRKHSTVLKGITKVEREMTKRTPAGRQFERALDLLEI